MPLFLRSRLKHVTHTQVLAAVFLLLLFYVAGAAFLWTARAVWRVDIERAALGTAAEGDFMPLFYVLRGRYADLFTADLHTPALGNKATYLNLNGGMAKLLGQRRVNGEIRLTNGQIAMTGEAQDVAPAAAAITELYQKQTAAGGAFLYVLTPYKIPKFEDALPGAMQTPAIKTRTPLSRRCGKTPPPCWTCGTWPGNRGGGQRTIFSTPTFTGSPKRAFGRIRKSSDT
jgi:hypothetical protein